jgi:NADH:ubiquinone oxidoreductase subunit C
MDLHPGANFYEREIHDLMGIEVTGRGKLERLVVPDGWPEGHYPLRKDWPGLPGGESA